MSPRLAAALVVLLGAGLAHQAMPADAAPHGVGSAAPAARVASTPLIKGVVVDQFGSYVDGLTVRATNRSGDAAASADTYASLWPSGPQHGFFFLEVGAKGSYTLTLSKTGYQTTTLGPFVITKPRQRLALGELVVKKVRAATVTTAALRRTTVSTKDHGRVTVTVSSRTTRKPAGEVEVREGRTVVGSGAVTTRDGGRVSLTLDKLGRGSHTLGVYFLGSKTLAPSRASKNLTLRVTRTGR